MFIKSSLRCTKLCWDGGRSNKYIVYTLGFLEENWREKFQLKLAFTNQFFFCVRIPKYFYALSFFFIFSTHELPQENSMP